MPEQPSFDSSSKIAHIHGGPRDGGPPGDGQLEARVIQLEKDMTEIKVSLGRLDEKLTALNAHVASKGDVGELKGELKGKLGFWQFLGVIALVIGIMTRWPELFRLIQG